jgi:hypothetical protein
VVVVVIRSGAIYLNKGESENYNYLFPREGVNCVIGVIHHFYVLTSLERKVIHMTNGLSVTKFILLLAEGQVYENPERGNWLSFPDKFDISSISVANKK